VPLLFQSYGDEAFETLRTAGAIDDDTINGAEDILIGRTGDHSRMKRITVENYKEDRYYAKIVKAVAEILDTSFIVTPVDVLIHMTLLTAKDLEDWRLGRIPYLERVIQCNLAKASRILRILRMHAHDLNLKPSQTVYMKYGRGRYRLRFSKTGDPKLEEAYSRHYIHLARAAAAKRQRSRA
jgi:hypothetical protein